MKTLIDFIKNLKSFYRFYKNYEYNGAECEFIIENYQKVLCSRKKTMSKPTYYANSVIGEMDRWYEDSWKPVYKLEPIERTREIGESTDKIETCEFSEKVCEKLTIKDCSICKYRDEDLIFNEETGEEYPFYKCQKGNDTSLDYECKNFERYMRNETDSWK